MPAAPRRRPAAILVVALCTLAVVGGCSSLTPQIFSERLLVQRGADGSYKLPDQEPVVTLDLAYADAAFVRRRYVTAVHDQGNATPQLSAGLIGLSALALFKGVTSPNTRDLAGVGVLGSTAWAYGNTLLSRPRQDVYRAGAEALSCAMAVVDPLRRGKETMGQAGDAPTQGTLYGLIARVETHKAALERLLERHAGLKADSVVVITPAVAAGQRTVQRRAACNIPADASPARRLVMQAECDARPAVTQTVPTPAVEAEKRSVRAPAVLLAAFREAEQELKRADGQLDVAEVLIKALEEAGPLLWRRSVAIQLAVSKEVDKTIPDLASVMRAAQGLRESGFMLTGAPPLKPPSFAAQGGREAPGERAPSEADSLAQRDIEQASHALSLARVALDRKARSWSGVTDRSTRDQLNECAPKISGVQLHVTPAGDEIAVAVGTTAVFFVSGGSGVPGAQIAAGSVSAVLPVKVEGGQFRFEFTPPATMQPGETAVLRFTDGAGAASHLVQLRITAPVKGGGDGTAPEAPAADTTSAVAKALAPLFRDQGSLQLLGLPAGASESQVVDAIEECRKKRGITAVANDANSKALTSAVKAGNCKVGG